MPSREQKMDLKAPEVQIAWARIVARAAVDEQFRRRLKDDPATVFQEFGITLDREVDLNKDFSPSLDEAIASIERQRAQAAVSTSASASTGAFGSVGAQSGRIPIATSICYCNCACSPCATQPCGAAQIMTAASSQSAGAAAGGQGGASMACNATISGCFCGGYCSGGGTMSGVTGAGCSGSFGTAACFGSVGGCIGTLGTAGSYGCGGDIMQTGLGGGPSSGATPGSFGISGAGQGSSQQSQLRWLCGCSTCFFTFIAEDARQTALGGGSSSGATPSSSGMSGAASSSGATPSSSSMCSAPCAYCTGGISTYGSGGGNIQTGLGGGPSSGATPGSFGISGAGTWGSAFCFGTLGTVGGCGGTVGTAGSYGSSGDIMQAALGGGPSSGATLSSFGTYGSGPGGGQQGQPSMCSGSPSCIATGSACGTYACFGYGGTAQGGTVGMSSYGGSFGRTGSRAFGW